MAQIRGFFPLPFTSPQNTQCPNVLTLVGGQTFTPPAGEYLIQTGDQTCIQVWDASNALWRNYAPPMSITQLSMDGANYRLINLSGCVVGASITAAGTTGTNGIGPLQSSAVVAFTAPASGRAAQGYGIVGGSVPAPTVTQAGSGFLVPPIVCCDPPPQGGIQATFTCTLTSGGGINTVTQLAAGAGYTSIPQFYIVPQPQFYQGSNQYPPVSGAVPPSPGGAGGAGIIPAPGLINPANVWTGSPYQGNIALGTTGALLTGVALTGTGTLTGVVMTDLGQGYLGSGTLTGTVTGVGAATITPIYSFAAIAAIGGTVTASGGAAQIANTPSISSLGLIAKVHNNMTYFPRPIRGINSGATGSFTLEDPGFGLQGGAVFVSAGTSTTVATITNTQYGARNDTTIIQAMAQ